MIYEWQNAPKAQFAVIGDPVSHSLSPKMHEAAYKHLGLDHRYVAIRVPPNEVTDALNHLTQLGYLGVNVTLPNKEMAFGWASSKDPISQTLGVCNTLRIQTGEGINTDVPGFVRSIEGIAFASGSVLVMGAGGSAKAIIHALSGTGWEIKVWNRTAQRAEAMIKQLSVSAEILDEPNLQGVSLVVNTTSASLQDDQLPIENQWGTADRDLYVVDIAYGDGPTRVMRSAEEHGYRTMDGRRMLMEQGALSFEYWLDQDAPREAMLEALSSE